MAAHDGTEDQSAGLTGTAGGRRATAAGFDVETHTAPLQRVHRQVVEHGSFGVAGHRRLLVTRRS